jgi:hypothetical protein
MASSLKLHSILFHWFYIIASICLVRVLHLCAHLSGSHTRLEHLLMERADFLHDQLELVTLL